MSQRLYRIRGMRSESRGKAVGGQSPSHRLFPGSARDGAADEVEVTGDTVVRVELDNGFVLWSRVDDLTREYGTPPAGRRGDGTAADGAWEFSRLTPQRASGSERGMAGLAIRVLDFFGIDLVEASARKLGKAFEEKQFGGHPPGFYRLDLAGDFRLQAVPDDEAITAGAGPLLVFLHGTASSTEGSFGKLWDAGQRRRCPPARGAAPGLRQPRFCARTPDPERKPDRQCPRTWPSACPTAPKCIWSAIRAADWSARCWPSPAAPNWPRFWAKRR